MNRVRRIGFVLILSWMALAGSAGCALEDGLREGLTEGTSEALSLLVTIPVTWFLESAFPEPE